MRLKNLLPAELAAWLSDPARGKPLLLDVREPWEFQTCRIPDSMLVPMRELPARLAEIDPASDVVVICHHGARSDVPRAAGIRQRAQPHRRRQRVGAFRRPGHARLLTKAP
jgi:rhodanese-related sulfurtransferase